jgi:hypothetical protein
VETEPGNSQCDLIFECARLGKLTEPGTKRCVVGHHAHHPKGRRGTELYETKRRQQKLLISDKLREAGAQTSRKQLILREILVEAAGVELFSVLTARKLLILHMARGAQKAPLPIPLYVYCTKILLRSHTLRPIKSGVSHTCAATAKAYSPSDPLFRVPESP